jgi:hypothetical protein
MNNEDKNKNLKNQSNVKSQDKSQGSLTTTKSIHEGSNAQAQEAQKQPAGQENKQPLVEEKKEAPQPAQADNSDVAKKLEELEKQINRSRALNDSLEAKERELDSKVKEANQTMDKVSQQDRAKIAALHTSDAARMKDSLKSQEKVQIFVPLEGNERKGTQLPVTINGYRVNVPKGVYVQVPQGVAQVVMDSLNQTQQATDIPQNLNNKTETDKEKLA